MCIGVARIKGDRPSVCCFCLRKTPDFSLHDRINPYRGGLRSTLQSNAIILGRTLPLPLVTSLIGKGDDSGLRAFPAKSEHPSPLQYPQFFNRTGPPPGLNAAQTLALVEPINQLTLILLTAIDVLGSTKTSQCHPLFDPVVLDGKMGAGVIRSEASAAFPTSRAALSLMRSELISSWRDER